MTKPSSTENPNAVQNDLPDNGESPAAVPSNVHAVQNDLKGETVLFRYLDGTLALLPAEQAKALESPEPSAKLKVASSYGAKAAQESKGAVVPKDAPNYAAMVSAVQGKAPDGGDCSQCRGQFYRLDIAGNKQPVEV